MRNTTGGPFALQETHATAKQNATEVAVHLSLEATESLPM
jgi:hypothetical protein